MEPRCASDWTLGSLRYHWGSAYEITSTGPQAWHARRRDGMGEIHADSARSLVTGIRIDYSTNPMPRQPGPAEDQ
jgi:hypothetical protein